MLKTDNMRGAALMMGSMAAFVLNDACMKAIGAHLPLFQAIFLRGIVTSTLVLALALYMRTLRLTLPRRDWGLIALRTAGEVGATYFFLTALFHMPLANVTAILQVIPLAVALAAAVFLREPMGWRRLVAIFIGFCGVMLIVRPGAEGFTAYSVYALISVAFVTVRDLSARRLSSQVPSITVALTASVSLTTLAGLASFSEKWVAVDLHTGTLLAIASTLIVGGYLFSISAMRIGEIGFTVPFRYTGLLWALVLGYFLFGEWPDTLTMLGAVIVVAMGVFTLYRERRIARRAVQGLRIR